MYECSIEWYKNVLTNGEDVWPIEGIFSWIQPENKKKISKHFWMLGDFMLKKNDCHDLWYDWD